jgi:hypothetical protein
VAKTRQFEHLQQRSLDTLRALVPHDCPLVVSLASAGFHVTVLEPPVLYPQVTELTGRYQVIHAFISGFVAGWRERIAAEL